MIAADIRRDELAAAENQIEVEGLRVEVRHDGIRLGEVLLSDAGFARAMRFVESRLK